MYQRGSSVEFRAGPGAEVKAKLDSATKAARIEQAMTIAVELPLGPRPIIPPAEVIAMRWRLTIIRDNLDKIAANKPPQPQKP